MPIKIFTKDTIFDEIVKSIPAINRKNKILGKEQITTIEHSLEGIPIIDYYKIDEICNCSSDKIIVNLITESYHTYKLYKYPKDKIYYFFSNGSWKKQMPSNHILLNFSYFLRLSTRYDNIVHTAHWFDNNIIPNDDGYFCALIGTKNFWRNIFVEKMFNAGLENNFISYRGERLGLLNVHDAFKIGTYDSYNPFIEEDIFNISMSIPTDIFNATSFCLVVESNIYDFEEFHLTEKTIKCLTTGMPFVILSSPYFLKNLRQLGFKTYSELWDESYDEIINIEDRMDAILAIAKKLKYFDWKKARQQLDNISHHNLRVLLNCHKIFEPQIINIVKKLNGH